MYDDIGKLEELLRNLNEMMLSSTNPIEIAALQARAVNVQRLIDESDKKNYQDEVYVEEERDKAAERQANLFESLTELKNRLDGKNMSEIIAAGQEIGLNKQRSQEIAQGAIDLREQTANDLILESEFDKMAATTGLSANEIEKIYSDALHSAYHCSDEDIGMLNEIYVDISNDFKSAETREDLEKVADSLGIKPEELEGKSHEQMAELIGNKLEEQLGFANNKNLRVGYEAEVRNAITFARLDKALSEQSFGPEQAQERQQFIENFIENEVNNGPLADQFDRWDKQDPSFIVATYEYKKAEEKLEEAVTKIEEVNEVSDLAAALGDFSPPDGIKHQPMEFSEEITDKSPPAISADPDFAQNKYEERQKQTANQSV